MRAKKTRKGKTCKDANTIKAASEGSCGKSFAESTVKVQRECGAINSERRSVAPCENGVAQQGEQKEVGMEVSEVSAYVNGRRDAG